MKRILIIEDDKFFQKFYATKFKEDGYEVDVAANGEDGIEKAMLFKPNLILLDIIMPRTDGFEVLRVLSKNLELKKIPVLVFSTLSQPQDVEKAKKLGAADYLNKSFFDYDKLKARITNLIKG